MPGFVDFIKKQYFTIGYVFFYSILNKLILWVVEKNLVCR